MHIQTDGAQVDIYSVTELRLGVPKDTATGIVQWLYIDTADGETLAVQMRLKGERIDINPAD